MNLFWFVILGLIQSSISDDFDIPKTIPDYPSEIPEFQYNDLPTGLYNDICKSDGMLTTTYDGAIVDFRGSCEYLVTKSGFGGVEVYMQQEQNCAQPLCIKYLRVKLYDDFVLINASGILPKGGDAFVNYYAVNGYDDNLEVYKYDSGKVISIMTYNFGLIFDGEMFFIKNFIPNGEWEGLCGNADLDKDNDKIDSRNPKELIPLIQDEKCFAPFVSVKDSVPNFEDCIRPSESGEETIAEKMCNAFVSEEIFGDCFYVLDAMRFREHCIELVCVTPESQRSMALLCPSLSGFAEACRLMGSVPGEWRDDIRSCSKECPGVQKWSEAAPYSVPTCLNPYTENMWGYSSQCVCPEGMLIHGDRCFYSNECPCFYKDTEYQNGDIRFVGCNTCTCDTGMWACTEGVCKGVADVTVPRYTTFDGYEYEVHDPRENVLFYYKDSNTEMVVTSMISFEEGGLIFLNLNVQVKTATKTEVYHVYYPNLIFDMRNGKQVFSPSVKDLVKFKQDQKGAILIEVIPLNVVIFHYLDTFQMYLTASFIDQARGLLGNFNGLEHDDLILFSGASTDNLQIFLNDWSFGPPPQALVSLVAPSYNPDAVPICDIMYSQAYDECDQVMNRESFYYQCMDLSYLGVDMACRRVYTFSKFCRESEVNVELYTQQCGYSECPAGMEYRVASECNTLCGANVLCDPMEIGGCYCPEGFLLNMDGTCVLPYDCGCFYDSEWYYAGTGLEIGSGSECACVNGVMDCAVTPPEECPGDMVWYECKQDDPNSGAACQPSCGKAYVCMSVTCKSGCICPSGLLATQDNKCVKSSECGCEAPNGEYLANGESYSEECKKCECVGGKFECIELDCARTCWAIGGSHFKSFDGKKYSFQGDCEYTLSTDYCPNNRGAGLYSLVTKNIKCGTTGMTCSKQIVFTVKNKKITLQEGKDPVIETKVDPRFSKKRVSRAITGFTDYRTAEIFTIKQKGLFTIIDTCIGITLLWDKRTRVYLRLTDEFKKVTCGLCGNYDGKDHNDFQMFDGTVTQNLVAFGNSWKFPPGTQKCTDVKMVDNMNSTCALRPERKAWSEKSCSVITKADGPFKACHAKLNPAKFYDICVRDTCGCDGGEGCHCLCDTIAHYAHECGQLRIPVEWRSNALCPLMCEQYNNKSDECLWHYRSCDTCITETCCDCQSPTDTNWCVEGCFPKCKEGTILDEMTQKCVPKAERETKCTKYSKDNMCRKCETCDVCKTEDGATLRVKPGERKLFPFNTDECMEEICSDFTEGDLCYNGTINLWRCEEKYKPIPKYNKELYSLTCVNSTTSDCKNCRDCEKKCIQRPDSCDTGKSIGERWREVRSFDPVPTEGPLTYCVQYKCLAHPDSLEPECGKQEYEVVDCPESNLNIVCAKHERRIMISTDDPCCPGKFICICDTCAERLENGTIVYDFELRPDTKRNRCLPADESNCCYTDYCKPKDDPLAKECYPKITVQDECKPLNKSVPEGWIWVDTTRETDCCEQGKKVCDSCTDYDDVANKIVRKFGETWNKKCLIFNCSRNAPRDEYGCNKIENVDTITCPEAPDCGVQRYRSVIGKDSFDCCDLYNCTCYPDCRINGNVYSLGQRFQLQDQCNYECVAPKVSTRTKREDNEFSDICPGAEKICLDAPECPKCNIQVGWKNDSCGCPERICKLIEKCPDIKCPKTHKKVIDEVKSMDECLAPCFECVCDNCYDNFDNSTRFTDDTWIRVHRKGEKMCETCKCDVNQVDSTDDCKLEICDRVPCEPLKKCPLPYNTTIIGEDECGCQFVKGCVCDNCMYEGKLDELLVPGSSREVVHSKTCIDTYTCPAIKEIGLDRECYVVKKTRSSCPEPIECGPDYIRVVDKEKSCCFDDAECCTQYKCVCVKCRFNGVSYNPGDTWVKDCVDYKCTNTTNEADGCKLYETSEVQCPPQNTTCPDSCYRLRTFQEVEIPDHCCAEIGCEQLPYCWLPDGQEIMKGTTIRPEKCVKLECYISDEDYAAGKCAILRKVDHCIPDETVCDKCLNKTIVQDECGCDIVKCVKLNVPTSCDAPAENQLIKSMDIPNECYSSKNCCLCDTGCYYKNTRIGLHEIHEDKAACKRMRCELPKDRLSDLGYSAEDIALMESATIFDDNLWWEMKNKLDYREIMQRSGIVNRVYDECSQDLGLCPKARDIGCAPSNECGVCDIPTEIKDSCNCITYECNRKPCPAPEDDIESCSFPKTERVNVTRPDPCCPWGWECQCPDGCWDSNKVLRAVNEIWDEDKFISECGDSKVKKTCLPANKRVTNHTCPYVTEIPCPSVSDCEPCMNQTDSRDDYCCRVVDCKPLNKPVMCEETPGDNMKITLMETDDKCFPSKSCCICEDTCTYKGLRYNVLDLIEDKSACKRMRCSLPKSVFESVGYSDIDVKSLTEEEVLQIQSDLLGKLSYRQLLEKSNVPKSIYSLCEQSPDYCPKNLDIGCEPVGECPKCFNKTIGKDACDCDIAVCTEIERCVRPTCPSPYIATELVDADECKKPCYNCTCDHVCLSDFDGLTRDPGEKWNNTHRQGERFCETCTCTTDRDIKDGCLKETCERIPCKPLKTCEAPFDKPVYREDDCGCTYVETCVCPHCQYENGTISDMDPGSSRRSGDTARGCYDTYTCKDLKTGPQEQCFNITKERNYMETEVTECINDNFKLVKDYTRSCCYDDGTCVDQNNCVCIKCMYKGKAYNPGETWTDECMNYICTNTTDPTHEDKCLLATKTEVPCNLEKPTCTDCYVLNHTIVKNIPEQCCDVFNCTQTPYCTKEDGTKVKNGSIWNPICERYTCTVSQEQYDDGACPVIKKIDHCDPDLTTCKKCFNKTIIKDECDCDKITCPPVDLPKSCTTPELGLVIEKIETGDECNARKDCCVCDNACYYKGQRKELFSVWWDEDACDQKRMRCIPPAKTLEKLGYNPDEIDFSDLDSQTVNDIVFQIKSDISKKYAEWMLEQASRIYEDCSQDLSFCPSVKSIGCPVQDTCGNCTHEVITSGTCDCPVVNCKQNPCPVNKTCPNCYEAKASLDRDACGCVIETCQKSPCPVLVQNCSDPEQDVYTWMDMSVDKCCKQSGCRCNYTKCEMPTCPPDHTPVRNVTVQKCCCPQFDCIPTPPKEHYCMIDGQRKIVGETWPNPDNHCKSMTCSYENAKSTKTKIEIFDKYTCRSKRDVGCSNGMEPYLTETKEGCCTELVCPCLCEIYGDPHFTTFDGISYDYQGKCTYTLMKDLKYGETEIIVDNEWCEFGRLINSDISCVKTLTIIHKGVNYTLSDGFEVFVAGEKKSIYTPWISSDKDVEMKQVGYMRQEFSIHSLKLYITYKTGKYSQSMSIDLAYETYEGQMRGLCGVCNNDPTDDLMDMSGMKYSVDQEGHVDDFAESWIKGIPDYDQPKCFPKAPVCPPIPEYPDCTTDPLPDGCVNCLNLCHRMSYKECHVCEESPCQKLLNDPIWDSARAAVNPEDYIGQCEYDIAKLADPSENRCNLCNSSAIEQFAARAERKGVCVKWRTEYQCTGDMVCPENQIFMECNTTRMWGLSCDNLNLVGEDRPIAEGCFCPDGMVKESSTSEKCIPAKCCGGCREIVCGEGEPVLDKGSQDECGCPVYTCSDSCRLRNVTTWNQQFTVDGKDCTSTTPVPLYECTGACEATESFSDGSLKTTSTCGSCTSSASTTQQIELQCSDGSTIVKDHEIFTDCECNSFTCTAP